MNTPAHALGTSASPHATASAVPWPLWAGVALMVLSLGVVAAFRFSADAGTRGPNPATPRAEASAPSSTAPALPAAWMPQQVRWQRALHFEDSPAGEVVVREAASGREIARYAGEQGFVRGTLRVLARERARRGIGAREPFLLVSHGTSRLMLADPATGERIHLESFGPSNVAVFARLLEAAADTDNTKRRTP